MKIPPALVLIVVLTACKKAGHPTRPPLPGTTGITGLEFLATNTQAVVTYDAPATMPCRIEASESPTYAPLVHDIDTALFSGENSDWRTGSSIEGTKHSFVLGKRLVAKAMDGRYYSRALQAATMHYVRVDCGGLIATGSFVTQTIPYGVTYQDVPQLDPARPGVTMTPTILDSRSQRIIDPHTGAEIRSMSLPQDIPYQPGNPATTGPRTWDGGYQRACGTSLIGPPPGGYLCAWPQGDGGAGVLYYLIPSTGETRYLGRHFFAYPYLNAVDSKFYASNNDTIVAYTYNGNYQQASPGSNASFSTSTVISGLCNAIHAFNAKFQAQYYCSGISPTYYGLSSTGDYIAMQFLRGHQDSYGWVVAIQISTGRVVGTMRPDQNVQTRWCGLHNAYSLYSEPAFAVEVHGFVPQSYPLGAGPYTTTYTGTSTLAPGSTSLTVAGDLQCAACGPDPDAPAALQVGDSVHWQDGTNETDQVTARIDAQHITISPTHDPHPPGASFEGACQYRPVFWKTLEDPYGVDSTGTKTVYDAHWPVGGHDDAVTDSTNHANDAMLTEHWPLRTGPILAGLGSPLTTTISSEPPFAGVFSQCYGNGCVSHPSAGAPGQLYLTDYFRYDGSGSDNAKLTLVSGQLYKYTHNPDYPVASIKQYSIAGLTTVGGPTNSLRDVSGIRSVLPADASGSYQWCRANAPNECVQGSAAGQEFVNVPGTPAPECGPNLSVCLNNFPAFANTVVEIGYDGKHSRVLTGGLTGLRQMNDYPNAKATGRGEYVIFPLGDVKWAVPARLMMAKRPPAPCQPDGIDRSTFVRHPIPVTAPAGKNVASAAIEFGYEENGSPNDHFCTSRREPCVAVAASVDDKVPFHFATTETYTRMPCATSCTITLPVLPMHIAYYQVRFFDAAGTMVASSGGAVVRE